MSTHASGKFRMHPLAAGAAFAFSMLTGVLYGAPATPWADARLSRQRTKAQPAEPIPVTNCEDDGPGSLRAAVASAVSGDVIDLTATGCSVITLTSGAIYIGADDLTLRGPGATALTISGNDASSVLRHLGYGMLTISDVTIAHGRKYLGSTAARNATGGCVYSTGSVSVDGVTVTNCYVATANTNYAGFGGGICAIETATVRNSIVTMSYAGTTSGSVAGIGGAIFATALAVDHSSITSSYARFSAVESTDLSFSYVSVLHNGGLYPAVFTTGNTDIQNSTIAYNQGYDCAGLLLRGDDANYPLHVVNSTISGNYGGKGSGICTGSYATVIANSTIAFNIEAPLVFDYIHGAGVLASTGAVNLQSTIVANNRFKAFDGTYHDSDLGGAAFAGANNLTKYAVSPATAPPDTIYGDPGLFALAYNGGTTLTHAIGPGSAAIDAGNNSAQRLTDQRGGTFARVSGAAADIGAYEAQNNDEIFSNGFD